MAVLEVLWISFDPWFFGDQSVRYCGIVFGWNSAELACFEAWRCQDTICGYKSAVPWIVKMVSFWWSRDFANNKSRKLKGRLGKVNSIRGKLVAGNRHESRVFWWMGSGKIVFVSTGMRFILFHQQNSSETSEPLRWHGNKTRVLCNNLWFAKGPQFQVQVLVEVQSLLDWAPKSYSCVEIQWNSSTLWQDFWWFAGGEFQWNSETDGCLPLFGDFSELNHRGSSGIVFIFSIWLMVMKSNVVISWVDKDPICM